MNARPIQGTEIKGPWKLITARISNKRIPKQNAHGILSFENFKGRSAAGMKSFRYLWYLIKILQQRIPLLSVATRPNRSHRGSIFLDEKISTPAIKLKRCGRFMYR